MNLGIFTSQDAYLTVALTDTGLVSVGVHTHNQTGLDAALRDAQSLAGSVHWDCETQRFEIRSGKTLVSIFPPRQH